MSQIMLKSYEAIPDTDKLMFFWILYAILDPVAVIVWQATTLKYFQPDQQ
jgi:hypothetical protein